MLLMVDSERLTGAGRGGRRRRRGGRPSGRLSGQSGSKKASTTTASPHACPPYTYPSVLAGTGTCAPLRPAATTTASSSSAGIVTDVWLNVCGLRVVVPCSMGNKAFESMRRCGSRMNGGSRSGDPRSGGVFWCDYGLVSCGSHGFIACAVFRSGFPHKQGCSV